jgi:hypothetical protein
MMIGPVGVSFETMSEFVAAIAMVLLWSVTALPGALAQTLPRYSPALGSNAIGLSQSTFAPGMAFRSFEMDARNDGSKTPCANTGSGEMRSIITIYSNPRARSIYDRELRQMRANGQTIISFVIWHEDAPWTFSRETDDRDRAFMRDSYCQEALTRGSLSPVHAANLVALIRTYANLGFQRIIVRFAPMGLSNPLGWRVNSNEVKGREIVQDDGEYKEVWDEAQFQSNWKLIVSTRKLVDAALDGTSGPRPEVFYDLGVELAGVWAEPWLQADTEHSWRSPHSASRYVRTLWKSYVTSFGVDDTIGFSIVPAAACSREDVSACAAGTNSVSAVFEIYRDSKKWPARLGFDIYPKNEKCFWVDIGFKLIAQALATFPEAFSIPLYIQETYANSSLMRAALLRAYAQQKLLMQDIFQWPQLFPQTNTEANDMALSGLAMIDQYRLNYGEQSSAEIQGCGLTTGG